MTARKKVRVPRALPFVGLAAALLVGAACGGSKDVSAGTTSQVSVLMGASVSSAPVAGLTAPLTDSPTPSSDSAPIPAPDPPVETAPTLAGGAPDVAVQAAPLSTPIAAPPDDGSVEPVVVLGTIEISKIGVNEVLYEGIRLTTFDRGPGHWPGTAMPGQFGNVVVGGHRTSHTKPFRHLDALVPGDQVVFSTPDGRFVYRVESTEIVTPDVTRVVSQNPGFTATLFACNPPGSIRQRIVVHLILATS